MRWTMIAALAFSFLMPGCAQKAKKVAIEEERKAGTLSLTVDTNTIDNYIRSYELKDYEKQVTEFYKQRNFKFAWIQDETPTEKAVDFVNMLRDEVVLKRTDTLRYRHLRNLMADLSNEYAVENKNKFTEFELLTTATFLEYAQRNWEGVSKEDSRYTNWKIARKELDEVAVLNQFLGESREEFKRNQPNYYQYKLLEEQLAKYREIERSGGWPEIPAKLKEVKPGDSSAVVGAIRRQLQLTGDLAAADSASVYDDSMKEAVINFQRRHGLAQTGTIRNQTLEALRVPLHDRIEQIMVNMERFRWFPKEIKGDHLIVNVPDFRLWVYNGPELQWVCNVVTGKPETRTVIFNDTVEYVVFSPYWNIPPSILRNEVAPAVRRNGGYLASHNMEVVSSSGRELSASAVNWSGSNFNFQVRQRPGGKNSLGWVKFLFPNDYDIYLHDTPARSLFAQEKRAFSHGCIRVEEPLKLAEHLLRNHDSWSQERIRRVMYGGKETYVKVEDKVYVYVAYFTSWVDGQGQLNFRPDIYGYDEKVKDVLFY